MANKRKKVCSIGGQAVLEGVMMRGPHSVATAVRDEYGEIVVESERITLPKEKNKIWGFPIIRGVVAFFDSMVRGTKTLLRSAEVYGGDSGEPSGFEKWLSEKTKINVMDIAIFLGLILGLALSLGLFLVLPQVITDGIIKLFKLTISDIVKNLIAGGVKIIIFISYILLVTAMKDIKRTFMYHGAEHKVINCYEQDMELTVENVQKMTTRNDRCGTSFILIVMIIAIIVYSFLGWGNNVFVRVLSRLAMLPVVAGVSYELLKLLARSDNILFKILKAPGLLMQRLTTKQPTDEMVEVALMAFQTVQKMESDREYPVSKFVLKKELRVVKNEIKEILAPVTVEEAETDWILTEVTGKKRSELKLLPYITSEQYEKAKEIASKRAEGRPLQYVLGYHEFYNVKLKVDESVLIPRPETEILAEEAIKLAGEGDVLDICTGSGAIALAIAKNTRAKIEGADISADAIELAKENAESNGLKVKFVESDLFTAYKGREFNLITANPPYIKSGDIAELQKEVRDYEPKLALDGGESGIDVIVRIAKEADKYLKENGTILIEIGIGQAKEVKEIFISEGYTVEVLKDLEGVDRIIKAIKGKANV